MQFNIAINIESMIPYFAMPIGDCFKQKKHAKPRTNKSLRERFGLADTYSASISRLIKEAVKEQIIKPLDDSTSNRYIRYIPSWA